jgi:hypothetical protein
MKGDEQAEGNETGRQTGERIQEPVPAQRNAAQDRSNHDQCVDGKDGVAQAPRRFPPRQIRKQTVERGRPLPMTAGKALSERVRKMNLCSNLAEEQADGGEIDPGFGTFG